MNYNEFFNAIKASSLQGAYLLHGEEEFVKNSALKLAQKLIPADMHAFNIITLTEANNAELFDACETLPLFFEKKLVISHGLSAEADVDKLIEYFKHIPDFTILLIEMHEQLQEKTKLLKFFISIGHDVLFSELTETEVVKWCMSFAVRNGVALDGNTARSLVSLVGTNMTDVNNELQKVIDMVGEGGVITNEIIAKCTSNNIEVRIFEMLDCFIGCKVNDGMRLLYTLLEDENEALGIASFLESRFKLMLEGRILMDGGLSPTAAASKMEGSKYANERACKAARKYSASQLASLVSSLADVGYIMMSGGARSTVLLKNIMISFPW